MNTKNVILACAIALSATSCSNCVNPTSDPAQKPQPGQTRNLLLEAGYSLDQIDAKLNEAFYKVFEGPDKVYFEVGDSMAYISDVKNHDVRTEGMSYGMMIAVQWNRQDIFDRLWRWAQKYMQHQGGPRDGYFGWSCKITGEQNSPGSASDGELYFITSLILASNQWGNNGDINYLAEAQRILNAMFAKKGYNDNPGGFGPFGGGQRPPRPEGQNPNGNGQKPDRKPGEAPKTAQGNAPQMPAFRPGMKFPEPEILNIINTKEKLITFVPDGFGARYTDPSYHIPVFYEIWAKYAEDGRADFYMECAQKSREYLHRACDSITGLNPDYSNYDGTVMTPPRGDWGAKFRFDSWRVPMNIALDYTWSGADADWQFDYGYRMQTFFRSQGVSTFVDQYNLDGTPVENIAEAGGYKALRHSIGLVGTVAALSLTQPLRNSRDFIDEFWNSKLEPYEDGYYDGYYDGLLNLFALMHLSGRYTPIEKK